MKDFVERFKKLDVHNGKKFTRTVLRRRDVQVPILKNWIFLLWAGALQARRLSVD